MLLIRLRKLCSIVVSWTYFKAFFRFGVAPSIEHSHLWGLGIGYIVDIGANKGQFTLAALKNIGSDVEINAFEPQVSESGIFESLFRGLNNVKLFQVAIGPEASMVPMNISRSRDSSSLLKIGPLQTGLYPGTEKIATEWVQVAPLVNFISPGFSGAVSLLKIDVQGFELGVLEGCEALLSEFDYIYCECSYVELYEGQGLAYDVIQEVGKHSFYLLGVYNTSYRDDGVAIQSDLLFFRPRDRF